MFASLADIVFAPASWSLGQILVAVIAIAAAIAIVYVALQKFGIKIPDWAVQIFWIFIVALVAIAAIRFLFSI